MNSATTARLGTTRFQLGVAAVALGTLWFVLCRQLSGEWSLNEQYSYGWFVPFFAAFLFWLRWEDRPRVHRGGGRSEVRGRTGITMGIAILALLVLVPVRLFEVANPDWRPLSWLHAAAVVALTLVVIWFAGGMEWVRHFAFPVCFIFVAVPWITAIEEPIVQGLMRTVAALATETITLFGIPAEIEGNLIRVSTGLVGVNEACSGVRSLQTSLMIGLLFGELKRLSIAKRCLLVLGALAIALIANFGRALFLVWIAATKDVAAVESWHDLAGYVIVAVVFLGALGLAAVLAKGQTPKAKGESEEPAALSAAFLLPPFYLLLCFLWLLTVEVAVEGWYRIHEARMIVRERWTARWPEAAKDFREVHLDETTRRILRFDEGRGATWRTAGESGADMALLYFFRWGPGKNSALLANLHRPDVCLPASGWTQTGDYGVRSYPVSQNFSLPFRHFLFAQSGSANSSARRARYAHAFYCLREDHVREDGDSALDREIFSQDPSEWSRRERVRMVERGRRHLGQQVMEFVLLTREEVGREEAETRFAAMVPELVQRK